MIDRNSPGPPTRPANPSPFPGVTTGIGYLARPGDGVGLVPDSDLVGTPLGRWIRFLTISLVLICATVCTSRLYATQGDVDAEAGVVERPFIYFIFGGGGFVGVACTIPILIISFIAMALICDHLFTVRRRSVMPDGLAEELHGLIANGSLAQAEQQCKLRPSFLASVILSGIDQIRNGIEAVEKAMEDACQNQAARLFRKIEFLAVIANIGTMLGLFGTVVGLVIAFKRVADTQGVARASDLAGGIYLAMMTTVEGLAVAIPCVAFYAIFKHRAEQLSSDAAEQAGYVVSALKRARQARKPETRKVKDR